MFRHFHRHFFLPQVALAGFGNRFFASDEEHCRFDKGHRGRRHHSRTRRGDIKFILLSLLGERPRHGYELIKEIETRFGGFRRLSPGSVYPTLQLLEEGGYLTSQLVEGKRVYSLTDSGRQLLDERTTRGNPLDDYTRDPSPNSPELIELSKALTQLNDAVTQIARNGNLEQAQDVRSRLVELRREIYRILAEQ